MMGHTTIKMRYERYGPFIRQRNQAGRAGILTGDPAGNHGERKVWSKCHGHEKGVAPCRATPL